MTVALLHVPGFGDVGTCLRDARISSGVSIRALGRRADVAAHTIYLYEKGGDPTRAKWGSYRKRGTSAPNVRTIEEVAAALDVDLVFSAGRWDWRVK